MESVDWPKFGRFVRKSWGHVRNFPGATIQTIIKAKDGPGFLRFPLSLSGGVVNGVRNMVYLAAIRLRQGESSCESHD